MAELLEKSAKLAAAAAAVPKRPGSNTPARKVRSFFRRNQYTIAILVVIAAVVIGVFLAISSPTAPNTPFSPFINRSVNDEKVISKINKQNNFAAKKMPLFENKSLTDLGRVLGRVLWSQGLEYAPECSTLHPSDETLIPDAYDVREKYPKCFYEPFALGTDCASSWATASAETTNARLCMEDPITFEGLRMSPQDMLSCDQLNKGCLGGTIDGAMVHAIKTGLISTYCFPYEGIQVPCGKQCPYEQRTKIAGFCKTQDTDSMKREIMSSGPVTSIITLKDDFLVYAGGVYRPSMDAQHLTTVNYETGEVGEREMLLTHAVTVVGWGKGEAGKPHERAGEEYWIVLTNFGPEWGENGYARIAINSGVVVDRGSVAPIYKLSAMNEERDLLNEGHSESNAASGESDFDEDGGANDEPEDDGAHSEDDQSHAGQQPDSSPSSDNENDEQQPAPL